MNTLDNYLQTIIWMNWWKIPIKTIYNNTPYEISINIYINLNLGVKVTNLGKHGPRNTNSVIPWFNDILYNLDCTYTCRIIFYKLINLVWSDQTYNLSYCLTLMVLNGLRWNVGISNYGLLVIICMLQSRLIYYSGEQL